MGTTEIRNSEDLLDSRDVVARVDWLASMDDADADELVELSALQALAKEAADYSEDWAYGATLVRDSYFVEYAQELAEDIGAISSDLAWPARCIDWEQAARELRMDYTSVDFDGVTYWVR